MSHAIDEAPSPISFLAICKSHIRLNGQHFEIDCTGQRYAMLGDIDDVLVSVELYFHHLYIRFAFPERKQIVYTGLPTTRRRLLASTALINPSKKSN